VSDWAEEARRTGDWQGFVFAHEEADRPRALLEIESNLGDTEYWKLVRLVWTHADFPSMQRETWRKILTNERPDRHELMEPDEREALAEMDEDLLVFRGHVEGNRDGWSWTCSSYNAHQFAKRPAGRPAVGIPKVTWAWVKRDRVIAYFNAVNEQEILVDPICLTRHETITA
jgi:hypothetical protein